MNKEVKTLQIEAISLTRKMQREYKKLKEAAERELIIHEVIETSDDDVRGDLISLIMNAKPEHLPEHEWFQQLEARGGCTAKTYARWRALKVKRPTSVSERATLRVLRLAVFYGRGC